MTIKVSVEGEWNYATHFVFSGGEVQTKIDLDFIETGRDISVNARLQSSDDVMSLLQVKDIIDRAHPTSNVYLHMYYAPYARQDRVCSKGESLAAKVFAKLINSCGFIKVFVADCHSDVLVALLDNCYSISVRRLIAGTGLHHKLHKEAGYVVSPDAGANKKVFEIVKSYPLQTFVRADKVRCTETGEITGTEVYCEDFQGKPVVILDDICDGGRTFVELAKKLKEKNAGKITLYVTHGIFSKGLKVFEGLIEEVWTTDSLYTKIKSKKNPNLNIIYL